MRVALQMGNPQMATTLEGNPENLLEKEITKESLFRVGIVLKNRILPKKAVEAISSSISSSVLTYIVHSHDKDESETDESIRKKYNVSQAGDRVVVSRAAAGFQEMIQSGQIDCAYIIVPSEDQRDYVIQALEAKLHVLLDDPVSTFIHDFQEQLGYARKNRRFLQFPTMFVHQHRVKSFVDCVLYEDFGPIESINVILSVLVDDVWKLGIEYPPHHGDCVIRRLMRYSALISALMFSRARKSIRPVSAQVLECETHPKTKEPTFAKCRVNFTDGVKLECELAYSTSSTRQVMEVSSKDRCATLNDFVIPHPDGLATYRVYDKDIQGEAEEEEAIRGEALDVPCGPSQDVMMWRTFQQLCATIEEEGWVDSPKTHLARELTSVSLQTKLILTTLKQSEEMGCKEVPISLEQCDVRCEGD